MRLVAVATLFCALTGCASLDRQQAVDHSEAGLAARDAGDWATAREHFSHAIQKATSGNDSPQLLAELYYEYGRASGVVCDWRAADAGLKRALELDAMNSGPVHLDLIELGRLRLGQARYADAQRYFADAYDVFLARDAETIDPLGYVAFLEEYAATLEHMRQSAQARVYRVRAAELKQVFPQEALDFDRITPYGSQCQQS